MTRITSAAIGAVAMSVVSWQFAATVAAGQSGAAPRAARSSKYTPPRTADGHPELQGTWNFSTLTPVERPTDFQGKAALTLEEAMRWEKQTVERNDADRRDGTKEADVGRAYNDAWYDRGTHMAVIDGMARTSLIVDPPDGRLPALTAEAQARQAARAQQRRDHPADGPEDRGLAERCLGFNAGPPMMPGPYNNYMQLFQFKDYVIIFNEMIHDARIVPTDGRPHAPATVRKYLGDSIGRWDGDTLVVDTTNFTDKTNFRGASDRMHLVERFSRVGADTLLYEFTVEDASAFTKPWSVAVPMKQTDEAIFEYACHEGNHGMEGILRGERFAENERKK